jgi:hypothetical protein
MYTLLDSSQDGPVLHFTFATPGLEDHEWHHATLAHPITEWFHEALRPVAQQNGQDLTADAIISSIAKLAAHELIPIAAVDWLGLALLGVQFYCDAAGQLASTDTPEVRQNCSYAGTLAAVLCDISEQFAGAVQNTLLRADAA